LFYIEPGDTGEQFINKFFNDIFMSSEYDLNNYTFYVHNLGRFDSIFIIKSLVKNKKYKNCQCEKITLFYL